jgi:hypothetical protein
MPYELTEFDNIDYSLVPGPVARRKIAPAGKVAISSASAPRQQPPIASVSPIPPCPVLVWNAHTRTLTWVPRHTQRGYSPDMQRYATPQPVSRQPVVTRASQPIATKAPLNNAAVYLAGCGRMRWAPCTKTDRWLCLRNAATSGCNHPTAKTVLANCASSPAHHLRIQRPEHVGALNAAAALASSSSSSSSGGSDSS